jgi:hypothetical protein
MSGSPGMYIHKDTQRQLEILLNMLAEKGEDYTFRYIRKRIVPRIKKQKK